MNSFPLSGELNRNFPMSQTRIQLNRDQVKKLESLSIHNKHCEVFKFVAKIFLIFSLASSVLLVLYTTLSHTYKFRFPVPKRPELSNNSDPSPTNISHILFGISGSVNTWKYRSRYSSIWWNANETRCFVWMDEIPQYKPRNSAPPYRVSSPEWKRFKYGGSRSAVRIARIITDSFKLRQPNVRWFVMGDDDTVYFTHNLVSMLAKYDHNQMWYIGGNSESVEQDVMHSYDMAFGGGGFAISYPLAEVLVNVLDDCLDRYYYFWGSDQRIWACVDEIGVPLTLEHGFHQHKKNTKVKKRKEERRKRKEKTMSKSEQQLSMDSPELVAVSSLRSDHHLSSSNCKYASRRRDLPRIRNNQQLVDSFPKCPPPGTLLQIIQVIKTEGWGGLYRGLKPSLLGTAAAQLDIRGNPYGLLASHPIAPLISLHHLDTLDSLFPHQNQIDSLNSLNLAYRTDPPRILQQSLCYDYTRKWSISVSWGYTVQIYPKIFYANDLRRPLQTYKTWRSSSNGPFTFNTQPVNPDPCQSPVVFMLEKAEQVRHSGSLTSYKIVNQGPGKTCNLTVYQEALSLREIKVSAIQLDPGYWTKDDARRRQCCALIDRGVIKENSLQIRIRKCRRFETVTNTGKR